MDDARMYRFSWWRVLSFGAAGVFLWWAIFVGGGWVFLVHVPTFVFVVGLSFLLCLGSFGSDFLRFIPAALRVLAFEPLRAEARWAEIARFASRCVVGCAAVATLVGMVQLLRNMTSPNDIGAGMALSMLPSFYALAISELFLAVVHRAYAAKDGSPMDKTLPVINAVLPLAVGVLMVAFFFVGVLMYVQRA